MHPPGERARRLARFPKRAKRRGREHRGLPDGLTVVSVHECAVGERREALVLEACANVRRVPREEARRRRAHPLTPSAQPRPPKLSFRAGPLLLCWPRTAETPRSQEKKQVPKKEKRSFRSTSLLVLAANFGRRLAPFSPFALRSAGSQAPGPTAQTSQNNFACRADARITLQAELVRAHLPPHLRACGRVGPVLRRLCRGMEPPPRA